MTDLTAITTPFGLLDAETQEALKAHGGPYEVYMSHPAIWTECQPAWSGGLAIRVKPAPPKPREWWLSLDQKTQMFFQQSTPSNIDVAGPWIHVREVLPNNQPQPNLNPKETP